MADKYYRLVCFVVNICPEVLRELFIKLAKQDAGSFYTTIGAYLAHKQRDVMQLVIKGKIRDDQFDLLYPGHGTADEKQWDVTLLVTLITEMFGTRLKPYDIFLMKNEIRGIRNELQHLPNTSGMSDEDFDKYWERLDTAVMTLAKLVFNTTHEASFRKKIEDARSNNLPNLGDCLRLWYEEMIKNKLNEVESNTRATTSLLHQVTVQKPGSSGDKNKRIKVVDDILAKLQATFETTMKELPEGFIAPLEVADIRTKLRNNHHVVVTGSYNSRYFEAALIAIKGMSYNYKRCVEMNTSSDWRHIDPEDVEMVLCKNPFGSFSYDENKSKSMADIFNSMMHTTKGDSGKTLDIVMVTDLKILKECKQYHDHDILEEVVKVFDKTSEARPADLTLECRNQYSTSWPLVNNLRVVTRNFLNQYRISSSQIDEDVLKEARDKFKAKKAIVLTGPKRCGKTSVAVALASSYQPSQCILLTEPNDFKAIDFQNACLVIIDEFAGKYRYDQDGVYKWYTMFDHLYNAVTAGQMNVIITCERNKLDRCCNEISPHALLDHTVDIPVSTTVIKQDTESEAGQATQSDEHQQLQRIKRTQSRFRRERTQERPQTPSARCKLTRYDLCVKEDRAHCVIRGSCLLPSGAILLTDNRNNKLKKLDDRYQVISVCDFPYCPRDVCYIGNNKAVVTLYRGKLQFVDIVGNMTLMESVDTDHQCKGLAYRDNKLYVIDDFSVYIYSTKGTKQRVLYTHQSGNPYFQNISVNDANSLIYLVGLQGGLVTVDISGNHLYTLTDLKLRDACGVCVDDEGHVLVSCYTFSADIFQISSDGKHILRKIADASNGFESPGTLFFDREKKAVLAAGFYNYLCVLKLQY